MKNVLLISALIAASAIAMPAAANDDDIWTGDYWGTCSGNVQCRMEITNGMADKIDIAFIVADRMDFKKIKCKLTGKFTRSAVLLLEGDVKGAGKVAVGAKAPGEMVVMNIPRKACGIKLDGDFGLMGD